MNISTVKQQQQQKQALVKLSYYFLITGCQKNLIPPDQGPQVKICNSVNAVSCKVSHNNQIQGCSIPSTLNLQLS